MADAKYVPIYLKVARIVDELPVTYEIEAHVIAMGATWVQIMADEEGVLCNKEVITKGQILTLERGGQPTWRLASPPKLTLQ